MTPTAIGQITQSDIYWTLQMDSICVVAGILSGLALIASIVFTGAWVTEEWHRLRPLSRVLACTPLPFAAAMLIACAFIPNTKALAAMKVIPAIANDEGVQEEAGELYELAKQALERAAGVSK